MKIAFVVGANDYSTSLYKATIDVANEIRGRGITLDYIFWENHENLKNNDKVINLWGVSHSSLSSRFFIKIMKNIFGYHFYYMMFSYFFSKKITAFFHDNNYDVVYFHGANAFPFVKCDFPSYIVLHSCKYENLIEKHSGLKRYFYHLLYKYAYDKKKILTVSDSVKDDLVLKVKAKPLSIETIYNGFNIHRIENEIGKDLSIDLPDNFIMAAGRPDRTKRFDVLIKAYAKTKTKDTHKLVIFGEGRGVKDLKKLTVNLGVEDKVLFFGFISPLLPVYKYASLYVLSSDVEGLPTVVIESIISKTAVVATDAGGVKELLKGRLAKYIVHRGDIDELSDKIDLAIYDGYKTSWEDIKFLDCKFVAETYLNKSRELLL